MVDDFSEYRNLILKELERLNGCYQDLDTKVDKIITNVEVMKAKIAIFGIAAGVVGSLGINLITKAW